MLSANRKDGDESLQPESFRSHFFAQPTERLYQYYDEKKITNSHEPRIEDEEEGVVTDNEEGILDNSPDSIRRDGNHDSNERTPPFSAEDNSVQVLYQ